MGTVDLVDATGRKGGAYRAGGVGFETSGQCYKSFSVHDLQIFILSQSVCYTRPEKLTSYKDSTLLQKSEIYGQKSFITLGPGGSGDDKG
jgi:hypothetical protein